MKRLVAKLALLSLSLTTGAAFVARSTDAVAGEKCQIAVKGSSPPARKVMKDMVTAAKANGGKFSCDGCHQDVVSYELKPNAAEDYKKLQAAAGIK